MYVCICEQMNTSSSWCFESGDSRVALSGVGWGWPEPGRATERPWSSRGLQTPPSAASRCPQASGRALAAAAGGSQSRGEWEKAGRCTGVCCGSRGLPQDPAWRREEAGVLLQFPLHCQACPQGSEQGSSARQRLRQRQADKCGRVSRPLASHSGHHGLARCC